MPGLSKELSQTLGYQRIMGIDKIFSPHKAIIGMMLEIFAHQIFVQRVLLGGIAQRTTFSWQIEDKSTSSLDKSNSDSQQKDTTP